jgi:hypothetical protein
MFLAVVVEIRDNFATLSACELFIKCAAFNRMIQIAKPQTDETY